jgi:ankyrin repeat protein
MEKSDHTVIDEWLLLVSVSTHWFYGLRYCISNGINTHQFQAIRFALNSRNIIMFWFLVLFNSGQSLNFNPIMPIVVSTKNGDLIKQVLNLIRKEKLSRDSRFNCLIQAIDSCSIKLITDIWKTFDIDELISKNVPHSIANHIMATRNREIIQKFLKYGNIFSKGSDVFDWLDRLSREGDIEVIDMITNGRKTYFKHFPRNPLPFAANIKTVQYLLKHGADPNYRGQDGYTRMDLAIRNHDLKMIELLKKYGATVPQTADKE